MTLFFTLMHGAYEHATTTGMKPTEARTLLTTTIRDLYGAR